ncbi:MAG: AAA family ATPase, partial [Ktedonobacterales bacterium]
MALELPAGKGRAFARHVSGYITECRRELGRAFTSDAYDKQSDEVIAEPLARKKRLLEAVEAEALMLHIGIEGSPSGMRLTALKPAQDGADPEPMSNEEYAALPGAERERFEADEEKVKQALSRALRQVHLAEDEARSALRALDHDVADGAIRHRSELIAGAYVTLPAVQSYLRALRTDVVAHARALLDGDSGGSDDDSGDSAPTTSDGLPLDDDPRNQVSLDQLLRRYGVNVMVANVADAPAPVVVESNPTYANLMGRIDILGRQNSSFTDHMLLKPGSMHKAAGGFLIVQATDILSQSNAWEALSRMARFGQIELENGSQSQQSSPGLTIRPQPIRADVKVVVIGSFAIYGALAERDADFLQIF